MCMYRNPAQLLMRQSVVPLHWGNVFIPFSFVPLLAEAEALRSVFIDPVLHLPSFQFPFYLSTLGLFRNGSDPIRE
ncbi:hypothetical protein TNCV_841881 [Trichonephila clavipes]|uniref:Uncharacterized protein n=1 Tax=Trichonephila clavata TaxID=2740835 RepID=A0A8X6JX89_TRICU|nr:hypothetical protein TNCT_125621 [Trichonephila clavata]GFW41147.1 hypothetical protein TNCV_841881 [Trichonephila clavipes]